MTKVSDSSPTLVFARMQNPATAHTIARRISHSTAVTPPRNAYTKFSTPIAIPQHAW